MLVSGHLLVLPPPASCRILIKIKKELGVKTEEEEPTADIEATENKSSFLEEMKHVVKPEIENVAEQDTTLDEEADKTKHAAFRTKSLN